MICRALIVAWLVGATAVHAQPKAGQKVRSASDVDCNYWRKRISAAERGLEDSKVNREKMAPAKSFAKTHDLAVKAYEAAIPQYKAELAKCEARSQMGATGENVTGEKGAGQDPAGTMVQQLVNQLQKIGQQQTASNITVIQQVLDKIKATSYVGAGLQDAADDPLNALGGAFYFVDENRTATAHGSWYVGAEYGYSWDDDPTLELELRRKLARIDPSVMGPRNAIEAYCQAHRDNELGRCQNKCMAYWGRLYRTCRSHRFRTGFGTESDCSDRWCVRRANYNQNQCRQSDSITVNSAGDYEVSGSWWDWPAPHGNPTPCPFDR